jgi:hypothetical protein
MGNGAEEIDQSSQDKDKPRPALSLHMNRKPSAMSWKNCAFFAVTRVGDLHERQAGAGEDKVRGR